MNNEGMILGFELWLVGLTGAFPVSNHNDQPLKNQGSGRVE